MFRNCLCMFLLDKPDPLLPDIEKRALNSTHRCSAGCSADVMISFKIYYYYSIKIFLRKELLTYYYHSIKFKKNYIRLQQHF